MTTFCPAIWNFKQYAFTLMPCQVCLYTDDTAIIATSQQLALLNYLESYLSDQKTWLRNNIPKNTAIIFAKAGKHIPTSSSFREAKPLCWYLLLSWGWPLIHGWLWPLISIRLERKWHREWECWNLSWTRGVVSPSEMEFCCTSN